MSETLKFGNGTWATKKGSTLAYNDENGNFKPLPFTFDRSTSATRVNKEGLIEVVSNNEPRIDFLNDSNGALKLEPSRSNLITYSEDFSNSIWTNTGASTSVNPTADLSPDGNLTGNEFNEGSSDGRRGVYEDISVSANQSYTLSVFVKKGTSNLFRIVIAENGDALNWTALQVDLSDNSLTTDNGSNNSFTDISSSISDSDYNGYYRLTLTAKHTTVTSLRLLFNMTQSAIASSNSYGRADYTGTNKTVFVWGCQLESNSSYPTSYIPTQGSIGTRDAETCNGAGNDQVFNASEGILFVEMAALERQKTFFELISLSDGTTTNRMYLGFASGTNKLIWLYGANVFTGDTTSIEITNNNKIAFKFKDNDFAIWVNGVEIDSQLSGSTFSSNTFNTMGFDSGSGSLTTRLYANLKQIQYFDTALSDTELALLTSL